MLRHIAFAVAVVIVAVLGWKYLYEEFQTQAPPKTVTFMTSYDTAKFLREDPDYFVHNLSPTDLYARNAITHEEYLHRISAASLDFEPDQMQRFSKACQAADEFFLGQTKQDMFHPEDMAKIPWVLAMTEGQKYEEGLPHTRANIIFVASDIDETHDALTRTMIHEKMHIYQRMYPERMTQWMEKHGYGRWKQRLGEPRIRANPDLDPWIYIDPQTRQPMAAYYVSDKPSSIRNVYLSDVGFEHPYERMAYMVASLRWNW